MTIWEISKLYSCLRKSSIGEFLKNFRNNEKKTSSREDRVIERISLRDRFKTAEDIKVELFKDVGSARAVRRRLQEVAWNTRAAAKKKTLLPSKMRQNRLRWENNIKTGLILIREMLSSQISPNATYFAATVCPI